jgi:site-specific DNA recombinase
MEYCARLGWEVEHSFQDGGFSAKIADRPAFQEMLAYCRKHRKTVTHVVVHNITRFARDFFDHMLGVRDLKALNIVVRTSGGDRTGAEDKKRRPLTAETMETYSSQ